MSQVDTDYYIRRAEKELALARQSAVPMAVAAHYELARAYLQRAGKPVGAAQPLEAIKPQ